MGDVEAFLSRIPESPSFFTSDIPESKSFGRTAHPFENRSILKCLPSAPWT